MISLSAAVTTPVTCPNCGRSAKPHGWLWQGIHIGLIHRCPQCQHRIFSDLPIGQACYTSYQVDLTTHQLFGPKNAAWSWFGLPLLHSFQRPNKAKIIIKRTPHHALKADQKVVVLNCLDYLYGHALLKLFNTQQHLRQHQHVIVVIPSFLRWLVPAEVAEIWEVQVPPHLAQHFYPQLHSAIAKLLRPYRQVYLSSAHSHPAPLSITQFTKVPRLQPQLSAPVISFIWREDRPWLANSYLGIAAKKIHFTRPFNLWQVEKIIDTFSFIHRSLPSANFQVVGLGKTGHFPIWIRDYRVTSFSPEVEKQLCQLYARSTLIVGVHGSSMLLPSAMSHLIIDLLPSDRIGNILQDLVFDPDITNPQLLAFKYRILPIKASPREVATHAVSMITKLPLAEQAYQNR